MITFTISHGRKQENLMCKSIPITCALNRRAHRRGGELDPPRAKPMFATAFRSLLRPACRPVAPALSRALPRAFASRASVIGARPPGDALLMKVSGEDRLGITARFTEILKEARVDFYDVDQLVVHNNLSLYFVVSMPHSGEQEASFIRNVLDRSRRESVNVEFEVVHRATHGALPHRAPSWCTATPFTFSSVHC